MNLFDTHCHLDDRAFKNDVEAVIARAREVGVAAVMTVGTDRAGSQKAVELAASDRSIFAAVGTHPHDAKDCTRDDLDILRSLARNPRVKAWGEIGLDFNRMYSPRESQERWFLAQLAAAGELGLPVILHERDSRGRLLELLEAHPNGARRGVVHCFSGNEAELKRYLELGFFIGITGILTLQERGAALRKLCRLIPQDRLVIETDAPYLTPAPEKNRIRRNEPAFVRSVMLKLAEVRGADPAILSAALWQNSCRLYDLAGTLP